MSALRSFVDYVKSQAATTNQSTNSAGTSSGSAGNATPQTDESKLRANTAFVSPDGGSTDEAFPAPDVEYDFCCVIANEGKTPAGAFFVRFKLSGDVSWEQDDHHDEGLKPGQTLIATVHYGKLTEGNDCRLSACVFAKSDPNTPIHCGGEFGFVVEKPNFD